MSFNTFCNICFIKQNIIKLNENENEHIFNILISLTSCSDRVNGIIYLCINCCNKLEEYDRFRELILMNFVRFRYLYNEQKKKLEIHNEKDIETQLKTFVDVNVERPSGTPLIENYEAAQALRNNAVCNVDIACREPDKKFCKVEMDELPYKNTSDNEAQSYHVNAYQKHIYDQPSPYRCEEAYEPLESDTIANVSCCKSENDFSGQSTNSENFLTKDIKIEADEPNPYPFEEARDPLAIDTIANDVSCRKSTDDICGLSTNSENFVTEDIKIEEEESDESNHAIENNTHTVEKSYACDECHKTFTQSSKLIQHKRIHSSDKPHKCDECGLGFARRDHLIIHKRKHTGERPYRCDECEKTFSQSIHLTEHKRIHSGAKPYKCEECGMGFAQRSQLNSHKRTHTGEKPYPCDECPKAFTAHHYLMQHKRIHGTELPYKCDECGLGFARRDYLIIHTRTHTGERPYRCDECDKAFTTQSYLIEHKRYHRGDKRHKCDECGLGFIQRKNLNRHIRTHTGEKPYRCDECDKAFSQSTSLVVHKRTHSGEKPYKCDECGLGFAQHSQLSKHKRRHTGERPYPCDECQKSFIDKYGLLRHKSTHNKQTFNIKQEPSN